VNVAVIFLYSVTSKQYTPVGLGLQLHFATYIISLLNSTGFDATLSRWRLFRHFTKKLLQKSSAHAASARLTLLYMQPTSNSVYSSCYSLLPT